MLCHVLVVGTLMVLLFRYLYIKLVTRSQTKFDLREINLDFEEAVMFGRLLVPGDSPAYYTVHPFDDILKIKTLNLIQPNRSKDQLALILKGTIEKPIGINPGVQVSFSLNGRPGPELLWRLSQGRSLEIFQNGKSLAYGEVPQQGKVEMSYKLRVPYRKIKKGWYTLRVEMVASGELCCSRITGFEGGIWLEGEKGDGCNGWVQEESFDLDRKE